MDTPILICTDLDRTLLPNGPEEESENARVYFSRLVDRPEVTLAYVSGRNRALVEKAMTDYALPRPDYVIGDVGTTIYTFPQTQEIPANPQYWSEWEKEIAPDWSGYTHHDLKKCFEDLSLLRLQKAEKQNKYKLSYDVSLNADITHLKQVMYKRLEALGIKGALVWSVDVQEKIGLLDVLPVRATKYHAVMFLMTKLGFSTENTVFSGDSGNDLEVLTSEIPAVLVANSSPEVRAQALALAEKKGTDAALYLARGGWMQMNGHYSAGILEGVTHFLPGTKAWFRPENRGS